MVTAVFIANLLPNNSATYDYSFDSLPLFGTDKFMQHLHISLLGNAGTSSA
jgi:hypothetical protein